MPQHAETSWNEAGLQRAPANSRHGKTHFGDQHDHKSAKAVIGIAVLLILSFVLYEINGKTTVFQTWMAPANSHHIAWTNR